MTTLEFEQLLTFWTLKGKLRKLSDVKMGYKKVPGGTEVKQVKALVVESNGNHAKVVYSELMNIHEDEVLGYEIEYADITSNVGISKLYRRTDALIAMQNL